MALSDYLAKNYLSADAKPSKKRKRKVGKKADGLTIEEDGANDWTQPKQDDEDEDDGPTILGGGLNKPAKKSKWLKIGSIAPSDADQQAADAILVDAQRESSARAQQDDDAPAVVDEDGEDVEGPTMASGAMAGLQTADQVTKALKRKAKADRKAMEAQGMDPSGKDQETIYRDASGRIINVAMKRAELRAKEAEEERKQKEELENRRGDVQRREKEERKRDLEDMKVTGFARHADDKKLNDELKERERWNDPMAQLIQSKKSSGGSRGGKSKSGGGKTYHGAFEPNRYGIKPGWRWDGVDRSNGFEKRWFAARNAAKNREALEYHWEMDE